MQFKSYSEADFYKKKFWFNSDSVEEWEDEQYYKIDAVVDKKIIYESLWYKIKWTGYGSEENTWL